MAQQKTRWTYYPSQTRKNTWLPRGKFYLYNLGKWNQHLNDNYTIAKNPIFGKIITKLETNTNLGEHSKNRQHNPEHHTTPLTAAT